MPLNIPPNIAQNMPPGILRNMIPNRVPNLLPKLSVRNFFILKLFILVVSILGAICFSLFTGVVLYYDFQLDFLGQDHLKFISLWYILCFVIGLVGAYLDDFTATATHSGLHVINSLGLLYATCFVNFSPWFWYLLCSLAYTYVSYVFFYESFIREDFLRPMPNGSTGPNRDIPHEAN